MDKISVGIGEGKTAVNQQILISYALGSCVGVCMYDRDKKIAGMAISSFREKSRRSAGRILINLRMKG